MQVAPIRLLAARSRVLATRALAARGGGALVKRGGVASRL